MTVQVEGGKLKCPLLADGEHGGGRCRGPLPTHSGLSRHTSHVAGLHALVAA